MLNFIGGVVVGILLSIVAVLSNGLKIKVINEIKRVRGDTAATIVPITNPLDDIDLE